MYARHSFSVSKGDLLTNARKGDRLDNVESTINQSIEGEAKSAKAARLIEHSPVG